MRIAIFSDIFYPEISGLADSIQLLGQELARRGHRIDFYVSRYAPKNYRGVGFKPWELNLGKNVKIFRLATLSLAGTTGQGRLLIPTPRKWREVIKNRPDILYSQLPFGSGLVALKASRRLKKPLIGTNHTAITEFISDGFLSAARKRLALKYYVWYYNQCDFVSAPSQSVFKEMIVKGFKRPHAVISNPLDFKIFFPVSARRRQVYKREFGLGKESLVYAGRLSEEKNIDVLIRALAWLKQSRPQALLVLAGNGKDWQKLAALAAKLGIKDSVKFLGRLNQKELAQVFNAAEIFTTASTSETQGMTVLQAMACGRPALGVRSRALPEYINKSNGALVAPGDYRSLAKAAAALLSDRRRLKKLGEDAYRQVRKFSRQKIADRWEEIFRRFALKGREIGARGRLNLIIRN